MKLEKSMVEFVLDQERLWHEGGRITGIEDAHTTDIMQEFHRDELLIIEKMIEDENL